MFEVGIVRFEILPLLFHFFHEVFLLREEHHFDIRQILFAGFRNFLNGKEVIRDDPVFFGDDYFEVLDGFLGHVVDHEEAFEFTLHLLGGVLVFPQIILQLRNSVLQLQVL